MRIRSVIAVLAGFGAITGSVVALEPSGWDKAWWGMTEREVGEVVSGVVPPAAKHETITGYEGLTVPSYMMKDCEFRAELFFNKISRQLEKIRLELQAANRIRGLVSRCFTDVSGVFSQDYGNPVEESKDDSDGSDVISREWRPGNTRILAYRMLFSELGIGIMTVDYEPIDPWKRAKP